MADKGTRLSFALDREKHSADFYLLMVDAGNTTGGDRRDCIATTSRMCNTTVIAGEVAIQETRQT
jgi:hypothetical protein